MAKTHSEWTVLPHGEFEKLAENLWWVQGSIPRMSLKRTMLIVRRNDGTLVIHNPIALEETAMRSIEAWGRPRFLLVPSGFHRLDAPAYKKRYPESQVVTPKGSRTRVEDVLPVDLTYEQFPNDDSVRLEPLDGVNDAEGVLVAHSADGITIVLNDVVFNMDRKRDFLGFVFTTLLGSAPGPRISRLAKLALIKDRPALRANLQRLAQTPGLVRLVVAHEKVAHGPAAAQALTLAIGYL